MSNHELNKQEGQEYVIVDRPPPSDAAATSLWSTITSAIASLTLNVDPCVFAFAARNGIRAFGDKIASRSTRALQFLQDTVATQKNLDVVHEAIVIGGTIVKTAASHCGSALSYSASAIKNNFLPIHQDFNTFSCVVNINGTKFVQLGEKILWVCFDNGTLCEYRFPVENLGCIKMFLLTREICMFLLYTTTGCVFASVYTTQYGRDITCLNRITQLGKENKFDLFETSDACMHGTVGLTVFYKDGSQYFFHVERDGAIHQILLICDSQDLK
jgi:hypothetical protein